MSNFISHFVSTPDGLKLHVRLYGPGNGPRLPVICLHGLARSSADFHRLASSLAGDPAKLHQVVVMDYRGRGRSDYDPNPANYNLAVELADVNTVMAALRIDTAVFIGTSRGGLLTMLMAATRPQAIAGAVLNDIGPVIEPQGLLRIKGYVGKLARPKNFDEAVQMLRLLFGTQFTELSADDWRAWAERSFEERDGQLVPSYDPALAQTLADFDIDKPMPPLWPQFDALAHAPLLVVRGENSDLLSSETISAMRARRGDLQVLEVPGQGHAPLLVEDDIIARISRFVAGCDRVRLGGV